MFTLEIWTERMMKHVISETYTKSSKKKQVSVFGTSKYGRVSHLLNGMCPQDERSVKNESMESGPEIFKKRDIRQPPATPIR